MPGGRSDHDASLLANADVAGLFAHIAALTYLNGDSIFKVRAYQKAAQTIESLQRPIAEIAGDEKALRKLPGFGKAITAKLSELAASGRMEFYERLRSEFPPAVLALSKTPGVQAGTVRRAVAELGVAGFDDLEDAIESGAFSGLDGVGGGEIQKARQAVRARTGDERTPLGTALPAVEQLAESFKTECPGVGEVSVAGHVRRLCERTRAAEIVCTAEDPGKATAAFVQSPFVKEVKDCGPGRAAVVLEGGLRADLLVTPAESFGTALLLLTGSRAHRLQLRERAGRMGLSLDGNGPGDAISAATEEEAYEQLGLPYIPPELREGTGEIEAAEAGTLPELVTLEDIRGDLHVHTDWSDGHAPMREIVAGAIASGREYVAITDHTPNVPEANGLTAERLARQRSAIEELEREMPGIRLLKGVEVDILPDGSLDHPDEVLAGLDVVLASVHKHLEQDEATMTRRVLTAMRNPHVDILGHPTQRLFGRHGPLAVDVEAMLRTAAETGTALEISASPLRLDLRDVYVRKALGLGVFFALGTDSHRPAWFENMRYGVGVARRGWCGPDRVINTLSADELLAFLAVDKRDRSARLS